MVCIQGALTVAYFSYVGLNATQKTGQKTSNIVQVIEFAILRVFWIIRVAEAAGKFKANRRLIKRYRQFVVDVNPHVLI